MYFKQAVFHLKLNFCIILNDKMLRPDFKKTLRWPQVLSIFSSSFSTVAAIIVYFKINRCVKTNFFENEDNSVT